MTPEQLDKITADRDITLADHARLLGLTPKALYRAVHNYRKKQRYTDLVKRAQAVVQEEIELAKKFGPHHIPVLVSVRNAIGELKG